MKAVLRNRAHVCKYSPAEVRVGKKVVLGVIPKKAKERQGILAGGDAKQQEGGLCVRAKPARHLPPPIPLLRGVCQLRSGTV